MSDGADLGGSHDGGHGGFGVSDLDVGHGHGHGFGHGQDGGHNHGGHVTHEALMVAHSHCDPHGWSGSFSHVSVEVNGGAVHDGVPVAVYGGKGHAKNPDSEQEFREKVRAALTDPNRRFYGAHVVGHGSIDVPQLFTRLAEKLGMLRICTVIGNFVPLNEVKYNLTDWDGAVSLAPITPGMALLLTPRDVERRLGCRVPAGYYDGGTGTTRIWRQYWQIGKRDSILPWRRKRGYDREQSTYIEVRAITWFYGEAMDYETRLEMRIISLPIWKTRPGLRVGDWWYRSTPWRNHQKACDKILADMFVELQKTQPSDLAKIRRCRITEQHKHDRDGGPEKDKLPPANKPLPTGETAEGGRPPVDKGEVQSADPAAHPKKPNDEGPLLEGIAEGFAGGHSGLDIDDMLGGAPAGEDAAAAKKPDGAPAGDPDVAQVDGTNVDDAKKVARTALRGGADPTTVTAANAALTEKVEVSLLSPEACGCKPAK